LVEEHTLSFHQDVASALRADREPRDAPPRGSWSVLAVGDPAFDRRFLPWLQPLPGARAEAEAVAALYTEGSELLLGPDATLDRLREGSPGRQVLHIAAHAVTSPGGLGDGLVLAGDGAAGGSSGLSSVRDLAPAIPPGLELVVLSGCSTLGTTPTRSSGLAGLARPFVSQGVPAVVGTLWPVDDHLLNDLMTKFHAGILAGVAASDALRQAQLDLLSASADAPCCDWAAVQLFGELPPADPDTMERGGS
jgi:CHAT domain-containing protein